MSKRPLIAVFVALLGSGSLYAQNILVASSRSNSIEEFGFTTGTALPSWIRTFATTGPYAPVALAQNPKTGEIFVTTLWASGPSIGQLTNRILRYGKSGSFDVNWDSFTVVCDVCYTTATQSLLFDRSGNLLVATAYGDGTANGPIHIFKYLAADLTLPNPPAQPNPIIVLMQRGNQMAFNGAGHLCIAGFIDRDVQCFDPSTGAKTAENYHAEILASSVSPGIEPAGLAFDSANRMYLTSVFGGQVVKEVNPGGPIELLATLAAPPNQLDGNLVLHAFGSTLCTLCIPCPSCGVPALATSIFDTAPPTFSTPDTVDAISPTSGAVAKLIHETAPPALGNDHIWGAYWMIFTSSPGLPFIIP
jgi:hypothetical protein